MKRREQFAVATAMGAFTALALSLDPLAPPPLDRRVREIALGDPWRELAGPLRPLYPIGLPGGYIAIAYATARHLHRRDKRGGPAIVTAAWLGWLVHRGIKLFYMRQRPFGPGKRYRMDSFPSGHTTGATALAVTTARVLHRERVVSTPTAAAIAIGAPVVMGSYRLIADDHWTTDVIGGLLLGGTIAVVCDAALGRRRGPALKVPAARKRGPRRRGRPARATSAA